MVLSLHPAIKHAGRLPTEPKSLLLSLRNVYETLAISAPTVVEALRGNLSREVCDRRLESWAREVVTHAGMELRVEGREHARPNTTYLVMSNHQSHYDVAVVYRVLGGAVRMIAKRELFTFPVFGRAMTAAGFISIDRQNTERAIASLDDARRSLEAGVPIWIAPEGTRSESGALLPFKKGGFRLALATGVPILPMSLRGTRDALPAHGLRTTPSAKVFVTIHPPIDPRPFAERDPTTALNALMEAVRSAIASGL